MTTKNDGSLPLIAELFPRSRFIHVVRDGRDVAALLAQRRTSEGRPSMTFDDAHHTWVTSVGIDRTFGHTLPENRYLELRYEDLIPGDVAQARDLFRFLGIDFDPAVEAFSRGTAGGADGGVACGLEDRFQPRAAGPQPRADRRRSGRNGLRD